MNAKEIFINLGNSVEIPINEDLEKAVLKDTPGYKVIKDYIEQLEKEVEMKDKSLDKACEELRKLCHQIQCKDCHFVKEQETEDNDCPVQGNCCSDDWKTWCLKDE